MSERRMHGGRAGERPMRMAPPLPDGMDDTATSRVANRLHSLAVRLLRLVRSADLETGLSPQRLSVLSVLVYGGPQTVSRLAAVEQSSQASMSRLAAGLERAGLVRRQGDPRDRRRVRVSATAAGSLLLERARARRLELLLARLEGCDASEVALLERASELLEEALGLHAASRPRSRAG